METRFVPVREGRILIEDIAGLMDEKTRLVALSFVEFSNGFRNDLKAIGDICREREIFFCVDAIQGLGALDLSVKENKIDFLSADGHKWLLAPPGCGRFYCSERVLEGLSLKNVGWKSVTNPLDFLDYDLILLPTAARFEEGTPNVAGIYGLGASLEMLLEIGIGEIEERVLGLSDLIISGLQEKGYRRLSSLVPKERSGIVTFKSDKLKSEEIVNRLREAKVIVSLRGEMIRVSPHFYNTSDEVARFLGDLP